MPHAAEARQATEVELVRRQLPEFCRVHRQVTNTPPQVMRSATGGVMARWRQLPELDFGGIEGILPRWGASVARLTLFSEQPDIRQTRVTTLLLGYRVI